MSEAVVYDQPGEFELVRDGYDLNDLLLDEAFFEEDLHPRDRSGKWEAKLYVRKALENLNATSRTASGVIDTSASSTKAASMVAGLSADETANRARSNFAGVIGDLYDERDKHFASPAELQRFIDGVAVKVNGGLLKEGQLLRSGEDSKKYPYTRIKDLPAARKDFFDTLLHRLNDPKTDPLDLAAWAEYRIDLSDHFYADGCGKTAKAVSAWILMRAGRPLPTYPDRKQIYAHAPKTIRTDDAAKAAVELKDWTAFYRSLQEALDLAEAAIYFDPVRHPRWPKGTEKGGQFIKVGQYINIEGKEWQVAHIVKGRVYLHEASGKYKQVETRAIDIQHGNDVDAHGNTITTLFGAKDVRPRFIKGGKDPDASVTIIDPYVDFASHDPSIAIPAGSKITPEQWKRFGRVDQDNYVELMERFGQHSATKAQGLLNDSYAKYESSLTSAVKHAYDNQYQASSGTTMSLTTLLGSVGHLFGYGEPSPAAKAAFRKREQAMELQGEHKAIVQWDLYNRARAPDILAVHKDKHNHPSSWWMNNFIKGDQPLFSGMSHSWQYRRTFFGQVAGVVSPLAIRHVLMSTSSAIPSSNGYNFKKEREVSIAEQMRVDAERSFTFDWRKIDKQAVTWLESETANVPQSGELAERFKAYLEQGQPLGAIKPQANIHLVGSTALDVHYPPPSEGKKIHTAEFAVKQTGSEIEPMITWFQKDGLRWQAMEKKPDGTIVGKQYHNSTSPAGPQEITVGPDEVVPIAQAIKDQDLAVGGFIQGMQGSRYIVVSDPNDTAGFGLRYAEIDKNGAPLPGNVYSFEGGGARPFFVLDGSWTPHAQKVGEEEPFNVNHYSSSTELKPLGQMPVGTKISYDGAGYEITGEASGGVVPIKQLETNVPGTANAVYQSVWLVKKPEFGGTAEPTVAEEHPQPGDTFAWAGAKAVITKYNAATQQIWFKHQGHVKTFMAHDVGIATALEETLHRPDDYVIGPKAKLRDIPEGGRFHVGAGAKQKPYLVLKQGGVGKPTQVRDLSTGKETWLSRNTSYAQLLPAVAPEQQLPEVQPTRPKEMGLAGHDPDAYMAGSQVLFGSLAAGDKFRYETPHGGGVDAQALGDGHMMLLTGPTAGVEISWPDGMIVHKLEPKATAPAIPYDQLVSGDFVQPAHLKPGDQIMVDATAIYELVSLPTEAEGSPVVAEVTASGSLGAPFELGVSQYQPVEFYKKGVDAAIAPHAQPGPSDAGELPPPPGFKSYSSTHPSGGKAKGGWAGKHDRIKDMGQGVIFRDAASNLWKVKQAGANPIITDGTANYAVDGMLRGRAHLAMSELPQGDSSPPLSGPTAGAHAALTPNVTLKLGDLKVGDVFQESDVSPPRVVTQVGTVTITAKALSGDGPSLSFLKGIKPNKVALAGGGIEAEQAAKVPWTAPSVAEVETGVEAGGFDLGEAFVDGNGDRYAVVGKGNGVVHAIGVDGTYVVVGQHQFVGYTDKPIQLGDMLPNHDETPLSDLKQGDAFIFSAPTAPPAIKNKIWTKVGSAGAQVTGVSDGGQTWTFNASSRPTRIAIMHGSPQKGAEPAPPFVTTTNETANILGEQVHNQKLLQPGDVIQSSTGDYTVDHVMGNGHVVVNYDAGFGPSSAEFADVLGYKLVSTAAVQTPSLAQPPAPTAWSAETHKEGNWLHVSEFPIGGVFQGKNGGFHQVLAKEDGKIKVVSLSTGYHYTLPGNAWRKIQVPKDETVPAQTPPIEPPQPPGGDIPFVAPKGGVKLDVSALTPGDSFESEPGYPLTVVSMAQDAKSLVAQNAEGFQFTWDMTAEPKQVTLLSSQPSGAAPGWIAPGDAKLGMIFDTGSGDLVQVLGPPANGILPVKQLGAGNMKFDWHLDSPPYTVKLHIDPNAQPEPAPTPVPPAPLGSPLPGGFAAGQKLRLKNSSEPDSFVTVVGASPEGFLLVDYHDGAGPQQRTADGMNLYFEPFPESPAPPTSFTPTPGAAVTADNIAVGQKILSPSKANTNVYTVEHIDAAGSVKLSYVKDGVTKDAYGQTTTLHGFTFAPQDASPPAPESAASAEQKVAATLASGGTFPTPDPSELEINHIHALSDLKPNDLVKFFGGMPLVVVKVKANSVTLRDVTGATDIYSGKLVPNEVAFAGGVGATGIAMKATKKPPAAPSAPSPTGLLSSDMLPGDLLQAPNTPYTHEVVAVTPDSVTLKVASADAAQGGEPAAVGNELTMTKEDFDFLDWKLLPGAPSANAPEVGKVDFHALAAGSQITGGNGSVWEVVGHDVNTPSGNDLTLRLLKHGDPAEAMAVGETMPVQKGVFDLMPWVRTDPSLPPYTGEPQSIKAEAPAPKHAPASPQEDALQKLEAKYGTLDAIPPAGSADQPFHPFKSAWGSGGKYKHLQIGELKHGQKFVDKLHHAYTFIALHGPEAIVMRDSTGDALRASRTFRVKLT